MTWWTIQYEIVVNIYVVGALCAFGIAGNVLSIVVLGRDQTIRCTTGFLMRMLAVTDAIYLVSSLFYQTLNSVERQTDWLPVAVGRVWPYVRIYSLPTACTAATAAVWMVVVLTADRYVAICRPLHAAQYSTLPRLRRAVAVLWVLAVAYNLPRFFEWRVIEVETDCIGPLSDGLALNGSEVVSDNATVADTLANLTWNNSLRSESRRRALTAEPTALRSDFYSIIYDICLYFVLRFLLPLALLVFFNQHLLHALHESDQLQCHSATGGGTGRQHTWMLVVVVIVFIVCQLPIVAYWVYWLLVMYANVPFSQNLKNIAVITANLMLTVNSSVNVVIYCLAGRQFRSILLRMIGSGGQHGNARQNSADPGCRAVPLHHVPTPHPPEQSQ